MENHKQDSVPRCLNVVRLFPAPGPRSSLAPIGIKQLSKSNELGAQHVSPHQRPSKERRPHLKVVSLPVTLHMVMFHFQSWSCGDRKKNVSGCSARLLSVKNAIHEDHKGPLRPQDISKWLTNRKADCCTLLKRITNSKM